MVCATEFAATLWRDVGVMTQTVRFGAVRDLRAERAPETESSPERRSVIYWRIATEETGGDLAVQAFDRVSVDYPDLDFKMILRPSPKEVAGVDQLAIDHENCSVHRFPYPTDSFLPSELDRAICAIFPYRDNTVDPQMSIVETLDFGVPCIVSSNRSNPELVDEGLTGFVCRDDTPEELEGKIRMAVESDELLHGDACSRSFGSTWSWNSYATSVAEIYSSQS